MTALTVDADIDPSVDLFDKTVDDLQSDVTVGEYGVSGIVNFIDDYSSAGYTGDEKSGHFLVLHTEVPDVEGVTITAEITNGDHGKVVVDPSDGLLITRIKNTTQQIIFTATKTGQEPVTKILRLNGLILA